MRLHVALWQKERSEMLRVFSHVPRGMCPSGARLLRHDNGDGEHSVNAIARHQDHPGPPQTRSEDFTFAASGYSGDLRSFNTSQPATRSPAAGAIPFFSRTRCKASSGSLWCSRPGRPALRPTSLTSQCCASARHATADRKATAARGAPSTRCLASAFLRARAT